DERPWVASALSPKWVIAGVRDRALHAGALHSASSVLHACCTALPCRAAARRGASAQVCESRGRAQVALRGGHGMAFNTMSIAKAREYVERAREKMAKIREHAEEAIGQGIQIAEVSGTAFAFGYANARWGGAKGQVEVFGLPADLGAAVALHGVAF